jgi:hypothetical protein
MASKGALAVASGVPSGAGMEGGLAVTAAAGATQGAGMVGAGAQLRAASFGGLTGPATTGESMVCVLLQHKRCGCSAWPLYFLVPAYAAHIQPALQAHHLCLVSSAMSSKLAGQHQEAQHLGAQSWV